MRLDDPTDNNGLGWRQLTRDELVHDLRIWLKVMPRWKCTDYKDRNPIKSDQAVRRMADDLADRLMHYPMFRAARLPVHRGYGSYPPGHECREE